MIFPLFDKYKKIDDKNNPFCNLYELEDGSRFYIEPVFYTQLLGFQEQFPNQFDLILDRLIEVAKKNKYVIFTGNYDFPQTIAEGYIILEITDITDKLKIYAEDKSRGSDYGD